MLKQKGAQIRKLKKEGKGKKTVEQKLQKKADGDISKPIMIQKMKGRDSCIQKVSDDFGLHYIPG